jgi:hypothetical protein
MLGSCSRTKLSADRDWQDSDGIGVNTELTDEELCLIVSQDNYFRSGAQSSV